MNPDRFQLWEQKGDCRTSAPLPDRLFPINLLLTKQMTTPRDSSLRGWPTFSHAGCPRLLCSQTLPLSTNQPDLVLWGYVIDVNHRWLTDVEDSAEYSFWWQIQCSGSYSPTELAKSPQTIDSHGCPAWLLTGKGHVLGIHTQLHRWHEQDILMLCCCVPSRLSGAFQAAHLTLLPQPPVGAEMSNSSDPDILEWRTLS